MWRLTQSEDNERGVVSIVTALLMVALLGFAAIAIDVGMMYAERGQLQNGADAAALAVANNCANGSCGSYSATALQLADSNANDGVAKVDSVTFPSAGTVRVATSSRDGAGHDYIRLAFASIFGIGTSDVHAAATAAWGGPSAGPATLPITFSDCQFDLSGTVQLLRYHMTDAAHTCSRGTSGLVVPGGFGWLQQDPGLCQSTININASGGIAIGSPGNNAPGNCNSVFNAWIATIAAGRPAITLLPVYDQTSGTGGGNFHIRGFAAFRVLGWKFSGGTTAPLVFHNTGYSPSSIDCSGSCRGIIGKFVQYVSLDAGFTPGGPDLGGRFVALTK
ncbi:pilus assembly protein TadG [Paenarthrobacter sp. Z7-10]|uniref:TadE/TadG family type IV pilus assembly protein n=1 Tax=Paenarthrobacter sp. Z7-10 TaxID=2787635 RepID=UPI0022A95C12|nr:pilus assembly protein TadG-related protein [Paenarthrobacter sp. Z7-10]MCZ2403967.1 pilus assembly protein TadG [Paenarthrobacter sp. Z7-10]